MPKSHTELICCQLADQLRQLIVEHTADGTTAARDFRFTSNLRDAIASACRNQSEGFYKYKHSTQRPYFVTARSSLGEVLDGIQDGLERTLLTGAGHPNGEAVRARHDREPALAAVAGPTRSLAPSAPHP